MTSSDHTADDATTDIARLYQTRHDQWAGRAAALNQRWNLLANGRLVVFAISLGLVIWAATSRSVPLGLAGLVAFVVFVVMVWQHRSLRVVRERSRTLAAINADALARVRRDWDQLPPQPEIAPDPHHPYDIDLDITGQRSLLHLLDTTTATGSHDLLRSWLLRRAPVEVIRRRQPAVRELAGMLDARQELEALGRQRKPAGPPDQLLAWAEGDSWLSHRRWLVWLARLLAVSVIASVVLQATGIVPLPLWLPLIFVNLIVSAVFGGRAPEIISRIVSQQGALQRYGGQLGAVAAWNVSAPLLTEFHDRVAAPGTSAPRALSALDRILSFSIPRGSLAYFPAQATVLWDIHVLDGLERWQARHGHRARTWLEALFEVEALCALAGLAHDSPDWAAPDVQPGLPSFDARALGHPLIPARQRVANDVTVGPAGSVLLVTGSNMSGKSTLLRSIGVNAVLANAGSVVCASSLAMPPATIWTSVRVTDSLAEGVSFFMAELLRLKAVVDAATDHAGNPGDSAFLYLLDEILQGTNSRERRLAVRGIVGRLLEVGAIGAVTTHDLDLARTPGLAAAIVPVHFREHIEQGPNGAEMRFDHLMRPGIATTTNALRLMEAIGLDVPIDDAVADSRESATAGRP